MSRSLTFVINPESQETSLDLFQKTIDDIRRLIRDLDYSVTREKGKRRWVIESLRSSAPTITIRHLLENDELIETIVNGIASVSEGSDRPPDHFNEPSLVDLQRMQRLFKGQDRARNVTLAHNGRPAVIGSDIGEKVEKIFKGGYATLGAIEGTLEAVTLHGNHPTFTIWDRVSKAPVHCYFPHTTDWVSKVKQLLEKRVMVRGRIRYFANGIPRSIADIQEILDETPNLELPKAEFGSLGTNRPNDMTEFLQRVREGA